MAERCTKAGGLGRTELHFGPVYAEPEASVCAASGSAGGQLHGLADVPEAVACKESRKQAIITACLLNTGLGVLPRRGAYHAKDGIQFRNETTEDL